KMEQAAASDPDRMRSIVDQAKEHGLIAHRFYGSEDGQIMVVDEWPDAQSFQSFFEQEHSRIQPLMQEAGVSSEPEVTFWRKLGYRYTRRRFGQVPGPLSVFCARMPTAFTSFYGKVSKLARRPRPDGASGLVPSPSQRPPSCCCQLAHDKVIGILDHVFDHL